MDTNKIENKGLQGFFIPDPGSTTKNLSVFNPKN
jgi:hypothetical protein